MHKIFLYLARAMAWAGGIVLAALILLTCLSILGRSLNGILHGLEAEWATSLLGLGIGPIAGDFELVEAGMAFAIFAFLPLCQITGGHASVDIVANRLPPRLRRVLQWLIELIFAGVLVLIAVQLGSGMLSKMRSGQTTFLLEFPIWWAYAVSMSGAIITALVACYLALMRSLEFVTGRPLLPRDLEGDA